MLDRRKFIAASLAATSAGSISLVSNPSRARPFRESTRNHQQPSRQDNEDAAPPQLDPKLVKQFVAFSHGNFKGVKELIGKEPNLVNASWDWKGGDWETGLGAASHVGNHDIAHYLLDQGARINLFAMTMLGHTEMVAPVVEAYPNTMATPGPHGIPLLSHAIYGRNKADEVFERLLQAGADINQASNGGQSPLMAAASLGRPEIVKTLLDHGADPNQVDRKGRTALDYARRRKRDQVIEILKKVTTA